MADTPVLSADHIKALLTAPEVAMYLHFGSSPQREVLGVAFEAGVSHDSGIQFAIEGHRVLGAEDVSATSETDNVFIITQAQAGADGTVKVAFSYPIEGVAGTAELSAQVAAHNLDVWEQ